MKITLIIMTLLKSFPEQQNELTHSLREILDFLEKEI